MLIDLPYKGLVLNFQPVKFRYEVDFTIYDDALALPSRYCQPAVYVWEFPTLGRVYIGETVRLVDRLYAYNEAALSFDTALDNCRCEQRVKILALSSGSTLSAALLEDNKEALRDTFSRRLCERLLMDYYLSSGLILVNEG